MGDATVRAEVDVVVREMEEQLVAEAARVERAVASMRAMAEEVPDAARAGEHWVTRDASRTTGVVIEIAEGAGATRLHDPAEVIAVPCLVVARIAVRYAREFVVADAWPGRVVARPGWEEAMRAERVPEAVVASCRRAIDALAPLPPSRRV